MRPSPLQLRHVIYTKVSVLPNAIDKKTEGKLGSTSAVGFDFVGVSIRAKVGSALKAGQDDDPRDFLVDLDIVIDNKEGKPTPYGIDIGVVGVFNVLPSLPKEKRQDLVTVNGASILYGVIREIVLLLTSRFSSGALTLPGMNFEDSISADATKKAVESAPKPAKESPSRLAGRSVKKR
ncbi:MAG: hypothetical protein WCR74_16215 [Betaproteobacteria bacterium]